MFDQFKKIFGLGGAQPLSGGLITNLTIVIATLAGIYLIPVLLRILKVPFAVRKFIPSMFFTIIIVTIITSIARVDVQHVTLGESYSNVREFFKVVISDLPFDAEVYTHDIVKTVVPLALQLCLLAYLDSLLTSLVIDKMTNEKTKHDKELLAQGFANGLAGLMQGIPGAQATIRSVLLIKEGAQTRAAGVFAGIFVLLGFLFFGKFIVLITSAVFTGVLLKAGLDVLDRDFPVAYFKNKWMMNKTRNIQLAFILYTTVVTVLVDLNVAVFTATIAFYIGKKYFGVKDAEDNFAEVHGEEIDGYNISENDSER
jgi:sulfate permease, SulP family